jgi:alkanesulfonate monooxygenase SsuD/methylene tetrahydromethanopterin reductase-like flavin-dependent oxidoreductase (luciferase family)
MGCGKEQKRGIFWLGVSGQAAFAQTICVADTDQEAEKLYAEHVSYFYNRCLHVYGGFADAPGYRTIKTLQANVLNALSEDVQKLFPTLTWKQLVDDGYVIAGSPATVRERMEALIKGLRVGHVFCLIHVGNMPDWKTRYSTQLFAEKVMPHLRNVWPEWQDDNRWWCKPLEDRLHPEENLQRARQHGRMGL